MRGNCLISKWSNMTRQEQDACHGTMTGDQREGPVFITLDDGEVSA
jgi:hypothetical protein